MSVKFEADPSHYVEGIPLFFVSLDVKHCQTLEMIVTMNIPIGTSILILRGFDRKKPTTVFFTTETEDLELAAKYLHQLTGTDPNDTEAYKSLFVDIYEVKQELELILL